MKKYLFIVGLACLLSHYGIALTPEQKAVVGQIKEQGYVTDAAKTRINDLYNQCPTIDAQRAFRTEFLEALKRNKRVHANFTSFFQGLEKSNPKTPPSKAVATRPRLDAPRKNLAPSEVAGKKKTSTPVTLPNGFKVIDGVKSINVAQVREAVRRGYRVERESVYWAFKSENKVLQNIILKKVPIDTEGPHGTALFMAASSCRLSVVKNLLDSGANINITGTNRGTALEAAAMATYSGKPLSYEKCFPVFEELIKRGATPTVRVAELVAGSRNNSVAALELLLNHGLKISRLIATNTTLASHLVRIMNAEDALAFCRLLLSRGRGGEIGLWAYHLKMKGREFCETLLKEFRAMAFARGEKLTSLADYKMEVMALEKNLTRNFTRKISGRFGDYGTYWQVESYCEKIKSDFINKFGTSVLQKYLSTMPTLPTFEDLMARKPIDWSPEILELCDAKLLPGYKYKETWLAQARMEADTKIIQSMGYGPEQLQHLKILLAKAKTLNQSFGYYSGQVDTSPAVMNIFIEGLPHNQDSIPKLIDYLVQFAEVGCDDDQKAILAISSPIFETLTKKVQNELGEEHYSLANIRDAETSLDNLLKTLKRHWIIHGDGIKDAKKAWKRHYLATALVNELNDIEEGDIASFLALGTQMASLNTDFWHSKRAKNGWLRKWTFVPIMKIIRPQLRNLAQGKDHQFFAGNLLDQLLKFRFNLNHVLCWDNGDPKGYTQEAEIPAVRELFREEFDRIRNADLAELAQLQPLFDELATQMKNLRREEFLSKGFTDQVISEILVAFIFECFHKNLATLKDQVDAGDYSQLLALQQELSEINSRIQLLSWQNTSLPNLKLADVLGDSALLVVRRHLEEQTELNPEFFQRLKEELLPLEKLGLFSREDMARVVFARAKPAYTTMLEAVAPTPITPRVGFLAGFGECPACLEEGELMHCPAGNEDCRGLMCCKCAHRHFNEIAVVEASWAQSACGYCHKGPIHGEFYAEAGVDQAQIDDCRVQRLRRQIKSALPEWAFCRNDECPNGTWFGDDENRYFDCPACWYKGCLVCGKDHDGCATSDAKLLEFLLERGKLKPTYKQDEKHPKFEHGKIRPCPKCGIMTNRSDGCNHIKCTSCEVDWHWNTGLNDLPIKSDRIRAPMSYEPKVPPHF